MRPLILTAGANEHVKGIRKKYIKPAIFKTDDIMMDAIAKHNGGDLLTSLLIKNACIGGITASARHRYRLAAHFLAGEFADFFSADRVRDPIIFSDW